jgi:hypothetical protein
MSRNANLEGSIVTLLSIAERPRKRTTERARRHFHNVGRKD